MNFKAFLAVVWGIYLCSCISLARRHAVSHDDENNMGHSHKLHHTSDKNDRGLQPKLQSNDDRDELDALKQNVSHESDCSSELHASFKMPSPFEELENEKARRNDKDEKDDDDDNDRDSSKTEDENVIEIRINKYYAVKRDRFYIRNTGHSCKEFYLYEFRLQLEDSSSFKPSDASIRGPDWDDEFILSKGVFHWHLKNLTVKNPDGTTVFNTKSTDPPLEMELVHYAKKYGSLEQAALKAKGVLVTGHLFELVGRDNPALEPISRSALSTTFPNDNFKQVHGPLDIKALFPSELSYFEYGGTYPLNPCATSAKYIVFRKPLFVSARQLKRFGGLRTEDGRKISDEMAMQRRAPFEIDGEPKGRAASANAIYLSLVNSPSLPSHGIITNPGMSKSIKQFYTCVLLILVALKFICNFFKFHIFFVI